MCGRFSIATLAVATVLLGGAGAANAEQTIVALDFGGRGGAAARGRIVHALSVRYRVLPGSRLLEACDELGIRLSRGRNLARCAQQLGAVAVVGGKRSGARLSLAVYNGEDGQPLEVGSVRWTRGTRGQLRSALIVILKGLRKAPDSVGRPAPAPAPTPTPTPTPTPPAGSDDTEEGLSFEPDDVSGDEPDASGEGTGDEIGGSDENPLAPGGAKHAGHSGVKKEAEGEAKDPDPKIRGYLGIGTWTRSFALNDPGNARWASSYTSGATFAMRFGVNARPLAFLMDNFAANIYLRLQYQLVVGLKSQVKGQSAGGLGTSLGELLFDVGYHWNIFDEVIGPRVFGGLGFGLLDFSIDWRGSTQTLPNVSYRFLLLDAGFNYQFLEYMGAHTVFDYRVVFSSGQIEDPNDPIGYGPSTTGGLSLTLGINANFFNIVAKLEYTYTRFFYAFNQAAARQKAGKRAAGGALDEMHGFMLSGGYSF